MRTLRIASAPCSYGVDEVSREDAWSPEPDEMLDWMLGSGYAGTEIGPPGFLGVGAEVRTRLERRGMALVGAFLPQAFSRAERAADDRAWLAEQLRRLRAATPEGSAPFAVLCEAIDEPVRRALTGRTERHPEAQLDDRRFATLMDNLHRAGELAREMGFRAVIHPHAGTYLETDAEIERMAERLDPSLVGLCLDTGHFRYGGADPAQRVRDYAPLIAHVHIKDCDPSILARVVAQDGDVVAAIGAGVFCGLGEGDAGIDRVIPALREIGYDGWLVVEQDKELRAADTRAALVASQRRNLRYLEGLGA